MAIKALKIEYPGIKIGFQLKDYCEDFAAKKKCRGEGLFCHRLHKLVKDHSLVLMKADIKKYYKDGVIDLFKKILKDNQPELEEKVRQALDYSD